MARHAKNEMPAVCKLNAVRAAVPDVVLYG
jgi:hypothetical protein